MVDVGILNKINAFISGVAKESLPNSKGDELGTRLNEEDVYRLLDILAINRCPTAFLKRGDTDIEKEK